MKKNQKAYSPYGRVFVFGLLFCFSSSHVLSETENIAIPNDRGMHLYWWPKVEAPQGCHHDERQSFTYAVNAFAPDGQTFVNADTVFYAKAAYKPRMVDVKSLDQFINDDKTDFELNTPGVRISETEQIQASGGVVFRSFTFFPKKNGNLERVSYADEGQFYLTFVISSRSRESYNTWEKIYEAWVKSYR